MADYYFSTSDCCLYKRFTMMIGEQSLKK
uniref:Uncharacterized protein n=1 Tax=Rhizophora mucronata TaxID=61149 RepID=A0A2P2NSP3_RHIMU